MSFRCSVSGCLMCLSATILTCKWSPEMISTLASPSTIHRYNYVYEERVFTACILSQMSGDVQKAVRNNELLMESLSPCTSEEKR